MRRITNLQPAVESLDRRDVPATFGLPWADPARLTLSFAPDSTRIAAHTSSLNRLLSTGGASTEAGKETIARAFQTWAVRSNINLGLSTDAGLPFGESGPTQGDPRFGDIRIGAHAMSPEALAISVPHEAAISGTWAGDVFFNSAATFNATSADLFSVALHEAGHVFGLDHSTDPASAISPTQTTRKTGLTSGDVANLQALYGSRTPDALEGARGNQTIPNAARARPWDDLGPAIPYVAVADITTRGDVDVYQFRNFLSYTGPLTFRVQTSGVSLLAPKLTVRDATGRLLGTAATTDYRGGAITVRVANAAPEAIFYVEVAGNRSDVFGIGAYAMAVTFDARNTVSAPALDRFLRGLPTGLDPREIGRLMANPAAHLNDDGFTNEDFATATNLDPLPGATTTTRFQAVGSLAAASDIDTYRLQSPRGRTGPANQMTVTLRGYPPGATPPTVRVFDRNFVAVPATILANGNGQFTVHVANVASDSRFFLKVGSDPSTLAATGNYTLEARFNPRAVSLDDFAAGTLSSPARQQSYNLYVAQTQLFQFLLTASASPTPGARLRMTIINPAGTVVYQLVAAAGRTVSDRSLFLAPGAYQVRFRSEATTGYTPPILRYTLRGTRLTDPTGPGIFDPTLRPLYTSPGSPTVYTYPGGIRTTTPYNWQLAPR